MNISTTTGAISPHCLPCFRLGPRKKMANLCRQYNKLFYLFTFSRLGRTCPRGMESICKQTIRSQWNYAQPKENLINCKKFELHQKYWKTPTYSIWSSPMPNIALKDLDCLIQYLWIYLDLFTKVLTWQALLVL